MAKDNVCRFCTSLSSFCGKEQVVEYRDGELFIGGITPTTQQIEELANEGMLLRKTSLWKLLTETVKAQAIDLGIRNAKDFDQLLFAKSMLHVVAVQESIINAIQKENTLRKRKSE